MAKTKPKQKTPRIAIDDYVLIGTLGITLPCDWFLAKVLWTDGADVLTEHRMPASHDVCRQVLSIDQVRSVGSIADVMAFQESCRKSVADFSNKVHDAERALGEARRAVYREIERIGSTDSGEAK
jgi:hypothetical protein